VHHRKLTCVLYARDTVPLMLLMLACWVNYTDSYIPAVAAGLQVPRLVRWPSQLRTGSCCAQHTRAAGQRSWQCSQGWGGGGAAQR
jgi:hypothetical protein